MGVQLNIITPEYVIYDGEVEVVTIPGKAGSFQILKNHAPIVASLSSGKVIVKATKEANVRHDLLKKIDKDSWELEIKGGVAELENNVLTILPD